MAVQTAVRVLAQKFAAVGGEWVAVGRPKFESWQPIRYQRGVPLRTRAFAHSRLAWWWIARRYDHPYYTSWAEIAMRARHVARPE